MNAFSEMPIAGVVVIIVIAILFAISVLLLFSVFLRYRRLCSMASGQLSKENGFMRHLVNEYSAAYKKYGKEVNTPAIIESAVANKLAGALMCERFLNNAVSLFVTLGLFGTFLGLSLSVSSLTELISYSNTSEWLSVLDSVGGGLMSALSGMGVAFYTSLVGVACSIVLTFLRSICSPQNEREKLQVQLELWLDNTISPNLPTALPKDDAELVHQMIRALDEAADAMDKTLKEATDELKRVLLASREPLASFNKTVGSFNEGVRDFSELNYNLRGTIERMDVSVRDLVGGMREVSRQIERSNRS